ncbi:MAG: PilT/PilU family type 4a pilus ATPase [Lentisphaeria bacterium]
MSILKDILTTGVSEGASDWHIREGSPVVLRIDGSLSEVDFVSGREFVEQAVAEVMPEYLRPVFQKTGDADFAFTEEGVGRFRANLHRQRGLHSLSLRHIKSKVPGREQLGLPPVVHSIARNQRGVVFITGTTGSGKSTTLASMLEHLNSTESRHIITIEDPIEYHFQDNRCVIEQRDVGLDCISYESGLTHVLRQDPDVIVIGEMRNRTTFETALAAAETGHLVFTTLHTTNAPQTVLRILDMFPHEERDSVRKSLASSLRAIICQRLVPRASGRGVIPALEILVNTPIVTKLLQENKLDKLTVAIDSGGDDGMISFNRSLLQFVNDGVITEEAALEYSSNPQALIMNLKGIFLNSDAGALVGE